MGADRHTQRTSVMKLEDGDRADRLERPANQHIKLNVTEVHFIENENDLFAKGARVETRMENRKQQFARRIECARGCESSLTIPCGLEKRKRNR